MRFTLKSCTHKIGPPSNSSAAGNSLEKTQRRDVDRRDSLCDNATETSSAPSVFGNARHELLMPGVAEAVGGHPVQRGESAD